MIFYTSKNDQNISMVVNYRSLQKRKLSNELKLTAFRDIQGYLQVCDSML